MAQLEKGLQAHRRNWFDAHDRDAKWELRKRDRRLCRKLQKALLDDQWNESSARAIANWDAYDQNSRADWFDPEWMFGLPDGFHIVIGNPPYIRLQKNRGELADRYQNEAYATFMRSGDTSVLFYDRGMELLHASGRILAYVTSNSWLKAKYGKKLRCLFTDYHTPLQLLELGNDVFDSAIVDSAVLIVRSGQDTLVRRFPSVDLELLPDGITFPDLPAHAWQETRPAGTERWVILSAAEWPIFYRMQQSGTPLREWDISINYGIKTGLNDAFVINDETREALIAKDPKSAKIIKPILKGKDIRRWRVRPTRWLIDTHNGYGDTERIEVTKYPAVMAHLDKFLARLEDRQDKGATPYNLRSCAYYEEFAREKLFWIDLTEEGRFAHSKRDEVFCLNSAYALSIPNNGGDHTLGYLCAMLNSRLVTWFMKRTALNSGMGVPRWIKSTVEQIPIPRLAHADQRPFADTTHRIRKAMAHGADPDVATLEAELDRLVYDLYGLRDDEIQVVEGIDAS